MLVESACQGKFESIIMYCQEKFMMTPKERRLLHEGFLFALKNGLQKYLWTLIQ
jgi:hypothetical protein